MPVWVNGKPRPEGTRMGARFYLWDPGHAEQTSYGPMRRCPNRACPDSFTPAGRCAACGTDTIPLDGSGPRGT